MMTPAQCRAARALLAINQDDLARLSRVGKRTIVSYESGRTAPIRANLDAIQRALEDAGVEFLNGDGVRLTRSGDGESGF